MHEGEARTSTVKYLHGLAHRTAADEDEFTSSQYRVGLITLAAGVAVAGVVILLAYAAYRCCSRAPWSTPRAVVDRAARTRPRATRVAFAAFVACVAAVFVASLTAVRLGYAFSRFHGTLVDVEDLVEVAEGTIETAWVACGSLTRAAGAIDCGGSELREGDIDDALRELNETLASVETVIDDIKWSLDKALRNLRQVVVAEGHYAPLVFFGCVGAFVVAATCAAVVAAASPRLGQEKTATRMLTAGTVWAAWIGLPVAVLVLAGALAASVASADFCWLGPTSVLVAVDSKNEYLAYYLQCEGVNPWQGDYEDLRDALDALVALEVDGDGVCEGPPWAHEAFDESLETLDGIVDDRVQVYLDCETFQPYVQDLVYDDFCDKLVTSLYAVWVVLAAGGFATLAALVIEPGFARTIRDDPNAARGALEDKKGDDSEGVPVDAEPAAADAY